ncbi:MAG TPA: YihY/virulence factor BrkB family protein [Daejeonella sp.]|nr:YihY/virulence factor BrkB family protein [Daejeonella sp.]
MYHSFIELKMNDPLRLGGATAFFATFALPPILIIFIQLFGLFINPDKVSDELLQRLAHLLGNRSAQQIKITLEAVNNLAQNWYVTIFGFLFLLFVATTLFGVIKNSLDQIWNIRVRAGMLVGLKNRIRSLLIILLAGLLFIVGLFTEGLQVFLGNSMEEIWQGTGAFFFRAVNEFVFLIIVTIWFSNLFRFLTAGRPDWNLAFAGGFFTGILFTAGKLVLKQLLSYSNIGTIYGASGSMVLILLFVFYSAMMFYYGGCFVKILSETYQRPIRPIKNAYLFELHEVERE